MKKSLRFQSTLMVLLHIFLLFLLLWTAAVPLEQIQQYAADNTGDAGNRVAFQGYIVQIEALIWSAIVFTAVIGFVIPWIISRRVQNPILSIRNTIRQICRGDLEARVQDHAGKEFEALANEFNGMMEIRKQEQEQLLGLNRTLSAITACRHVLFQESDEKKMIQEICRILVEIGRNFDSDDGKTAEKSGRYEFASNITLCES